MCKREKVRPLSLHILRSLCKIALSYHSSFYDIDKVCQKNFFDETWLVRLLQWVHNESISWQWCVGKLSTFSRSSLYSSWMSTWRAVERRIKCLRMLFSDAFVEGIFLSVKYLCSSLASTSTNTPSRFPLCMSYVGTSTTIRTIQGNCLRKSRSVVPKGPCLSHSTRLQKLKGPPLERSRTPIDARERERDRCSFEFARYSINAAKLFV